MSEDKVEKMGEAIPAGSPDHGDKLEKLGYGEAMERLDAILEDIDQGRLAIDVMAERVVEAAQLLKRCKGILTGTEAKVKDVLAELEKEFGDEDAAF